MEYSSFNQITGKTLFTSNLNEAVSHIGAHVHTTGKDGKTCSPGDFLSARSESVIFWKSLTGQVRHRIANGKVQGTIAGWIRVVG